MSRSANQPVPKKYIIQQSQYKDAKKNADFQQVKCWVHKDDREAFMAYAKSLREMRGGF